MKLQTHTKRVLLDSDYLSYDTDPNNQHPLQYGTDPGNLDVREVIAQWVNKSLAHRSQTPIVSI